MLCPSPIFYQPDSFPDKTKLVVGSEELYISVDPVLWTWSRPSSNGARRRYRSSPTILHVGHAKLSQTPGDTALESERWKLSSQK